MKANLLIFIVGLIPVFAHAQWSVHYLPRQHAVGNLRTAAHDSVPVNLPFWDDFSTSNGFPDTAHWSHSNDVNVLAGVGINPPSLNVATFDGADQWGNPHNGASTATGEGDVLTSRFIDLSNADLSSTYLSFYFQREGAGELPDQEDSLSLFVKGKDSVWVNVFNVSGAEDLDNSKFNFTSIPIEDPKFFFKYFQFKFVSYGRISGPYDTWSVDYVYLDENREGTIDDLTDRTITNKPSSIFKKFSAVPYDQFVAYNQDYLDSVNVDVINIEPTHLVQPININVWLAGQNSSEPLIVLDSGVNKPPSFRGMERRTVWSSVVDAAELKSLGDSLYLTTVFSINSRDTIAPINLLVNDTARTNFSIHEDLAYDDGAAEYGAGLNSAGSQIACRFFTPVEDQITGVKIYFPNFGAQSSGAFILKVWDNLTNDDSGLQYMQEAVVQSASALNEFGFYRFSRPVTVTDTFYVGFEQTINDFFIVGLDKNTNSGDEIFFNPDVQWEQNTTLSGSLMIRPVFGNAEDVITGLEPEKHMAPELYPNPSTGIFTYRGAKCYFEIYNVVGKRVDYGYLKEEDRLDLSGQKPGVYFLRLKTKNLEESIKLMIY